MENHSLELPIRRMTQLQPIHGVMDLSQVLKLDRLQVEQHQTSQHL